MRKFHFILIFFITFLFNSKSYSQGEIVYDFSLKAMPGWIWGGVEMKYSHQEDNKENGYAELYSNGIISANAYIGKIILKKEHLFTAGNYINIMLNGVKNDVYVRIQLLYDVNNDHSINPESDLILSTKPISINFDGWKEIKIKLDQENFDVISKNKDNLEITEENAFGIQLEFEAGNDYVKSKFESGIALISEIPNRESISDNEMGSSNSAESYFQANNFPNPFNPSTKITYTLPQSTYVSITVYDRIGRQIENLIEQNQEQGEHSVEFSANDLPSGIYFYRIKTPEKTEVRKMILAK